MRSNRNNAFQFLAALFALFIFTGDLVADAICDATGACMSENSQQSGNDDSPCCACAVHCGSAVSFSGGTVMIGFAGVVTMPVQVFDEHAPSGEPRAIDHPPQLA